MTLCDKGRGQNLPKKRYVIVEGSPSCKILEYIYNIFDLCSLNSFNLSLKLN